VWICSRSRRVAAILGFLVAGAGCGDPGDCLRYTDCDQGLTCAYGHCVLPPMPDAADDGEVTGDDGAASLESSVLASEASGDDGQASVDSSADVAVVSDLGSDAISSATDAATE
jgi:hypothetical protein